MYCWPAALGEVLNADNLRRRGIPLEAISDLCVLCWMYGEMVDHLFSSVSSLRSYAVIFLLCVGSCGALQGPR